MSDLTREQVEAWLLDNYPNKAARARLGDMGVRSAAELLAAWADLTRAEAVVEAARKAVDDWPDYVPLADTAFPGDMDDLLCEIARYDEGSGSPT